MLKYSDSPASAEKWKRLEKVTSVEFVSAMKDMYSMFDAKMVDWLAGLYDPKVGGFYYSESARDNDSVTYNGKEYKLLPDLESTCQALRFLESSGISGGRPFPRFIPEAMKEEIYNFAYNCQDKDGFFYHPQWGKDIPLSRRGRDLSWGCSILSEFGRQTKYPTVIDTPPEKRNESSETLIPEHLRSKEAFIEYLDTLDFVKSAYRSGNMLNAQFSQIMSQGLGDTCIDYLNRKQNPENGLWNAEANYHGNNGFMKISCAYNSVGRPIPHAKEAAISALKALASDEPVKGAVDIYNIWVSIDNIKNNLRKFCGEEGKAAADELVCELRREAVKALEYTGKKVSVFKEPDGGYSYCIGKASSTSQGMPVCIPDLPEGDINGNCLSVSAAYRVLHIALDLWNERVPLFGEEDGKRFLEIIEKKRKS